jgi:hypothetical protein
MMTSGIGIRSATVTAAVVLATAGWLTTTAPAQAAAPDPTATAQPSPSATSTTSSGATTGEPGLTLTPRTARPGDPVSVTFERWDFKSCALAYDDETLQPPSTCTPLDGVLTGSVTVPSDASPDTGVTIAACPTACNGDNTIVTGELTVAAPLVTTAPTQTQSQSQSLGRVAPVVTAKPPPPVQATSSTSGHTATLVAGGAVVVFLASALGLLLLRRRPPTIGPPPDIHLVPRPDPGVVTVDPTKAAGHIEHITIRLRPDEVHCRVEAMQR